MDFAYHYTEEQEQFRQEVASWLEANLPGELDRSALLRSPDTATWEAFQAFPSRGGDGA